MPAGYTLPPFVRDVEIIDIANMCHVQKHPLWTTETHQDVIETARHTHESERAAKLSGKEYLSFATTFFPSSEMPYNYHSTIFYHTCQDPALHLKHQPMSFSNRGKISNPE